jgi:hypothetical protein
LEITLVYALKMTLGARHNVGSRKLRLKPNVSKLNCYLCANTDYKSIKIRIIYYF